MTDDDIFAYTGAYMSAPRHLRHEGLCLQRLIFLRYIAARGNFKRFSASHTEYPARPFLAGRFHSQN